MKKLCFFMVLILGISASVSAISWEEDLDGDGREETIFKDSNNDGNPESAEVDKDGDGKYEAHWVDLDDDGDWDQKWEDTNGDGAWDKGLQDTDDDYKFDQKWSDKNSDGKVGIEEQTKLATDQLIYMDGPAPKLKIVDRIDCQCAGNHQKPATSLKNTAFKMPNWALALLGIVGLIAMIALLGRGKEVS